MPEERKNIVLKKQVVDGIKDKLSESKAFFVAKYDGIDVAGITKLRRELRKNGSEIVVLKNTLFNRAISDTEYAEDCKQVLNGPNAFAFSYEDPADTSKVLFDFNKENEQFKIRASLFEGVFYGEDKVASLKGVLSRKDTLAMFAMALKEPVAKVARIIDALREKKEKQEN